MESVSLEMDDIFGDHLRDGGEDDDEALPPRLPDLPEGFDEEAQATENADDAENQEVLARLKSMKGAAKRTVKRAQPKLDGTRLTGERGIPILPHVFKDVKLKGKGHEADDLRIVMRYLEHWAHRLFPRMPFDEVLERIERLGTKRDVQTCIKKMRLDMPVLGQDMVGREEEEEEERQDDAQQPQQEKTAADLFDELLREEEELMGGNREQNQHGRESNSQNGHSQNEHSQNEHSQNEHSQNEHSTETFGQSQVGNPSATLSAVPSADVLERMERNRRLAMERRANAARGAGPSQLASSQAVPVNQTS